MATIPLKDITFPGLDNTYTIPEIDSTLSTAGKAADAKKTGDEIDGLKEDLNELNSNFADMQSDGVVPSAEQILTDKGVTDSVPYHYRKTGGDGADRLYDQIVGGTVNWNQLFNTSNYAQSTTSNGITFTNNGDGTVTANGTATARANFSLGTITVISGHVYIYGTPDTNNAERWIGNSTYGTQNDLKYMSKVTVSGSVGMNCMVASGATLNNYVFKPQLFDLTAMFGSTIADYIYSLEQANAGAGVAWFKNLFPNDYYPYNAGELKSVEGLSEHKMVGFNQWDEEWEVGSIGNNGEDITYNNVRTKGYNRALKSTTYYVKSPSSVVLFWYDANKNLIAYISGINNVAVTSPSNASFFRFRTADSYGTTYNHDICINISDPAKNGTYEPYKAHSYPLNDSLTLRGVPKLVDGKMCFDGDTYDADGTVTRRYGVVDLGTLDWTYNANGYFNADVSINVPTKTQWEYQTGQCSRYNVERMFYVINTENRIDNCIAWYPNAIRVSDSAYTDATAFKSAMSGVMLVYELATPTTEEADPYQHLQQCDPNGTEEYVSTGIVPVGHNTQYPENLKAKIEGLPWNFATLIAPTESTYTATRNYTAGALFIVDNVLYKATSNIANGGAITPNTNCTATTLAEIISALA